MLRGLNRDGIEYGSVGQVVREPRATPIVEVLKLLIGSGAVIAVDVIADLSGCPRCGCWFY